MKKVLHFETFSGISGDMVLAALNNILDNKDLFLNELNKLNLSDYDVKIYQKKVSGINSYKVDITYNEQKQHRHLHHIKEIIDKSDLNNNVKTMSVDIFTNLAEAEAKVHNTDIEKVHFHEVGAIDAIIDIVGTSILLDLINPDFITCTPIPTGQGFVNCDHGKMPIPAPATAELLRNIPIYNPGIDGELVTPTGAAIIKTVCNNFNNIPPNFKIDKIGYGSGTIEREIPNLLRAYLGKIEQEDNKGYYIIETNIDDINTEYISHIIDKIIEAGALDVTVNTVIMKKGRIGFTFSAITEENKVKKVEETLFKETPTIGTRKYKVTRNELQRKIEKIKTSIGEIRVKKSFLNNEIINIKPEHDDIIKICKNKNLDLKSVLNIISKDIKYL